MIQSLKFFILEKKTQYLVLFNFKAVFKNLINFNFSLSAQVR